MATAELKATEIGAILKSKSVPSLPAVAVQLVKMCSDESVSVNDLAETLSMDPTLAGKILKLANSPKYCRREPVSNLKRACVTLGLKTLKIMSLSFSLTTATKKNSEEAKFDFDEYWFHSICKAVVGRDLSRLVRQPVQDEAFFCGLVGRIGQLFMANAIPERYNEVMDVCQGGMPSASDERLVLGFDLHDVGSELLSQWQLPSMLTEAVGSWSNPTEDSKLSQIILLSDYVATVVCSDVKGTAYSELHEKATTFFGLAPNEVDEFIATLKEEVETLADILDVKIQSDVDYADIMDDARQQMIEITLETRMEVEDLRARESRLLTEAQELQRVAQLDALTGIPNRGEFDKRFEEMLEARRKGDGNSNLGVLMIDVDHFKSFNDTHGHLAGDEVLKSVAQWMRDTVRPTDFLARYGGEEFAIILPNVNEIEAATVGERVRAAIEFGALEWEGTQLKVTASIGGATADVRSQELSAKELIKAADVCLYESKEAGRNQVTCRLM